jgi:hypothetical protein
MKRLIAFVAFFCMFVAFFTDLFLKLTITQFLYDSMMYIVIAGLGLAIGERMVTSPKKSTGEE